MTKEDEGKPTEEWEEQIQRIAKKTAKKIVMDVQAPPPLLTDEERRAYNTKLLESKVLARRKEDFAWASNSFRILKWLVVLAVVGAAIFYNCC